MSENHWETQVGNTTGYLSNTATDISAGDLDDSTATGYQNNNSLFSYFGRLFYNYDDRYLGRGRTQRQPRPEVGDHLLV